MSETEPRVLISVPESRDVSTAWTTRLTEVIASALGHAQTGIATMPGYSVDVAREALVEQALEGGYDYVFFVDSDTIVPADAIVRLMGRQKDIVAGLYRGRRPPFPFILRPLGVTDEDAKKTIFMPYWKPGDLQEVDRVGLGCMLIRTAIFEKMRRPWFFFNRAPSFAPGAKSERALKSRWVGGGEDWWFCKSAKEAGFRIWIDTSILCLHETRIYIGPESNRPTFRIAPEKEPFFATMGAADSQDGGRDG
jgi:hypothetical protein